MIGKLLKDIGFRQYCAYPINHGAGKVNLIYLQLTHIRDRVKNEIVSEVRL